MKGKLDGHALRVPVADGSITDFSAILGRDVTVDEVNEAFRAASESGPLSDGCSSTPRSRSCPPTSSGRRPRARSTPPLTMAMGNLVKVLGWYDNEWGYSNRLVDLVEIVASKR